MPVHTSTFFDLPRMYLYRVIKQHETAASTWSCAAQLHVDEAEMVALCSTMQVHEIVGGRRLRIPLILKYFQVLKIIFITFKYFQVLQVPTCAQYIVLLFMNVLQVPTINCTAVA